MTSPDPRPRPQFGEYATPEEQRAHIREPLPEHDARGSATAAPAAPTTAPSSERPPHAPAARGASVPIDTADPMRAARLRVDTMITAGLLVYGLFDVVKSLFVYASFPTSMTEMFIQMGVAKSVADQPRDQLWGTIAAIILIVGYLVTAYLSYRRWRAKRLAWWIPVVGAAVTNLAAGIPITIALANDPAMLALLETVLGSAG